jgi:hypothetical protein
LLLIAPVSPIESGLAATVSAVYMTPAVGLSRVLVAGGNHLRDGRW